MHVVGLSHYNLRGTRSTLEILRNFYTEIVGLTVGPRPPFSSFGYWLYSDDCAVLHLSEFRSNAEPTGPAGNSFDHAAFQCTGRAAFEQRLRERGIGYQTGHVPGTAHVQLFFRDPAGNGVELLFETDDA
jgi:catechol-2,3-dioxygenase